MTRENVKIFALAPGQPFAEKVAEHVGIALSQYELRSFEDGEHKARPLTNVRGRDVFVIESLYGEPDRSVNEKLCQLLFFIGALNDASAMRVTAVIPYLCYARKDRKTKARDPVTTRYLAQILEAVGTQRVVTMDVHNLAAFQNAFRCHTDHLEARKLFVDHFVPLIGDQEVAVVSPDAGGVKRAEAFREALSNRTQKDITSAFMEKHRSSGEVTGEQMVGDVNNRTVIIIDDLISTGTTLWRAAQACRALGARKVYTAATHGLFIDGAEKLFADDTIDQIVVTDTVPPFRLSSDRAKDRLSVIGTAELFADAIQRVHEGGSIVDLLEL